MDGDTAITGYIPVFFMDSPETRTAYAETVLSAENNCDIIHL